MILVNIEKPKDCCECPMLDGEYTRCQATHENVNPFESGYAPNCPIMGELTNLTASDVLNIETMKGLVYTEGALDK